MKGGKTMTFEEYIKLLSNFENQLTKSLQPLIYFQNQIKHVVNPVINNQQQIAQSLIPIINMQTRLLNEMYKPIASALEQFSNNLSIFSSQVLDSLAKQQEIFTKIATSDFYIMSKNLSETASNAICEISLNTISELDNFDYPEDFNDTRNTVVEYSTQKSPLNFEQVITIVSFIITVIMFIQSLMPNKQLTNLENQLSNIENALEQIIEIETNELNSLNEQPEQ